MQNNRAIKIAGAGPSGLAAAIALAKAAIAPLALAFLKFRYKSIHS